MSDDDDPPVCGIYADHAGWSCALLRGHAGPHHGSDGRVIRYGAQKEEGYVPGPKPSQRDAILCGVYPDTAEWSCTLAKGHSGPHKNGVLHRPSAPIKDDPINPKHYRGDLVMQIIEHFKLDFPLGNATKYILRHLAKGGIEDIEKAIWYLQRWVDYKRGKIPEFPFDEIKP